MNPAPDPIDGWFTAYAAPQASVAEASAVALLPVGEVVYARFWSRVAACLVDVALISVLALIATSVAGMLMLFLLQVARVDVQGTFFMIANLSLWLVPVAVFLGYFAGFHSSPSQATLGKMLVGVKLVRGNGERVSVSRAMVRTLLLAVSVAPLGAGVVVTAALPKRRALHDWLCDTRVVDRWAYSAYPQRQRQQLGVAVWLILLLAVAAVALLFAIDYYVF